MTSIIVNLRNFKYIWIKIFIENISITPYLYKSIASKLSLEIGSHSIKRIITLFSVLLDFYMNYNYCHYITITITITCVMRVKPFNECTFESKSIQLSIKTVTPFFHQNM